MVDQRAQAISVANHYFLFADEMISGFQNHLAEDVVLKWFGSRKITKKKNVTAFMLSNKMESYHSFHDIVPTLGINYEEERLDSDGASLVSESDDQDDDLNNVHNLSEPEITPQFSDEEIQNINRAKLKEEMAPTINKECGQGDEDGPVIAEANTIKYLEATGEIKFFRKYIERDSVFSYHWSSLWRRKAWRRKCKLQIAYSLLIDNVSPKIAKKYFSTQKNDSSACVYNAQKSKLLNIKEIIENSNMSIPDTNYFNGYLKPLNFTEDRENFLKYFETKIKQKDPNFLYSIHYVGNKLIFDFPHKRPFDITFQIHSIVYTAIKNTKKNKSLLHKNHRKQNEPIAQACN